MTGPVAEDQREVLAAAVDILIPPDAWPGGWSGGVAALLEHEASLLAPSLGALHAFTAALNAEAGGRGASSFVSLGDADRRSALTAACENPLHAPGALALQRLAFEGFYAAGPHGRPAGLEMVGFRGVPDGVEPVEPDPWPTVDPLRLAPAYDVVVVGAGAGGGVVAGVLAEGGLRVLLVERATAHTSAELRGDHFRGKRPGLYPPTAGPGPGNPRVIVGSDGSAHEIPAEQTGLWGLNAMTVGGGTRLWLGMAWRFHREDFVMASTYGVPDGSTLADWPIAYDDLAPYYERAEWEIGVSGEEGPLTARTPRARGYPMPALPGGPSRAVFGAAADRLGWGWGPIPYAMNSVPRHGRAACIACAQCAGHACPVDAKNGSHNTLLRRALATGSCDLLTRAQVVEIRHDGRGRATGARVVVDRPEGPVELIVGCDHVVVAAGAVETPRLLRVSGLGNHEVGRNLHNHSFAMVVGSATDALDHQYGPGQHTATLDFVHREGEAWGGAVLFDSVPLLPVALASSAPMLGGPSWGAEHKRWMREGAPRLRGVVGIGQDVPSASAQVTADSRVKDRFGMPVARLRGSFHPASTEVANYAAQHAAQWLDEVGCQDVRRFHFGTDPARSAVTLLPAAGEHSAGTCRMGDDPRRSATDRNGRLHGTDNVYVADASLHVTNGSVNPGLTVMANAFRIADGLLGKPI